MTNKIVVGYESRSGKLGNFLMLGFSGGVEEKEICATWIPFHGFCGKYMCSGAGSVLRIVYFSLLEHGRHLVFPDFKT